MNLDVKSVDSHTSGHHYYEGQYKRVGEMYAGKKKASTAAGLKRKSGGVIRDSEGIVCGIKERVSWAAD